MKIFTIENPGVEFIPIDTVLTTGMIGLDFIKDLFARIRDITGGRLNSYEKAAKKLQGDLLKELIEDAESIGADAIIGLNYFIMPMAAKGTSMITMTVYGTAVKLSNKTHEQSQANT